MRTVSSPGLPGVADLLGQLCMFRPVKLDERDTRLGRRLGLETEVWRVKDDGTPEPIGTIVIFNEVLLRDIGTAIGEMVVGRIEQPGRAYIFGKLSKAEIARAEKAERALTKTSMPEPDAAAFEESF
jgi:hypothetical protein